MRISEKFVAALALPLLLSACAGGAIPPGRGKPPATRPSPVPPPQANARGLEMVMGQDRAALVRLFGEPRLDVVEVYGRKLQFAGQSCVLDFYLYPDGRQGTEIVTHVDARLRDGREADRASCVSALQRSGR